jgi:hypothetical protein
VPNHTYSAPAIRLFFQLVMDAACSMRSASAVMQLLKGQWPALSRRPVANTGQLWLLRLGLFELTRPKEVADDWVWIVDHTVQIGTVKCLLIVGCRLSHWQNQKRPLEHRGLQFLALEPVEKSDGVTVCRQLQATCQKMGCVPRALLSDEGTDLVSGYREFSKLHPETAICFDIAHQAAKLLKRELEADHRWGAFLAAAGTAKQRLAQTPLAPLLPPAPRTKARYMNLDELVTWGDRALRYLDEPRPLAGWPLDRALLEDKLGWLRDYRGALAEWKSVMEVIATARHYVRHQGYGAGAAAELQPQLAERATAPMNQRLADRLVAFVAQQSAAARADERLPGSSECLESLIGKGKRLEGQQSRSGFTKMILGMAAAVVEPSHEYLQRALAAVKTKDVLSWCREHLGITVQAKRHHALVAAGTKPG